MKAPFLIGRAMLGGFFLYNAVHHFQQTDMIADYAKMKGVPLPKAAVLASGAMLALGGASMVTGVKPKYGVAALLGFLGTVTPSIHDFWNVEDPQQKMNDQINFFKNLALAGATLALAGVDEPWEASVPLLQRTTKTRVKKFVRDAKTFGRKWKVA